MKTREEIEAKYYQMVRNAINENNLLTAEMCRAAAKTLEWVLDGDI